AAGEMGLALSVVSKRLATLERRTDTVLTVRTTRRFALTEDGQRFLDRAQRILAEVDEAEAASADGRVEPSGVLRVSASRALGRAHVSPVCRNLIQAYPKMSADLVLTDRVVDPVDERMDVVVRIGTPRDSDLTMRKLVDNRRIIVAAPDYLKRRGTPTTPDELAQHDCLLFSRGAQARWRLVHPDGRIADVGVSSRLRCDNGEIAQDWAVAGCGLILKSWIYVASDLAAGRLVEILPDWQTPPALVCALFRYQRRVPTRARLFVDAMAAHLAKFVRAHATSAPQRRSFATARSGE
ncbi:MAG TPA: LysR substrate-binding domain-containing protein, partial [Bradyrhizobium sp.]|nr:LysR substrate-binding domain-containing protein [Bradyrhizobium sp.]